MSRRLGGSRMRDETAVGVGELAAPVARVAQRGDQLFGDVHRRQAGGRSPAMSVLSNRTEMSHQKISNVALPRTCSGRGPESSPSTRHLEQVLRVVRQLHRGVEVGDERERVELDQDVVAEQSGDGEAAGAREELDLRAELQRVRRQREVHSARRRKSLLLLNVIASRSRAGSGRRRLERRVEAADRQREDPLRAPAHAHRHAAGDRELADEPRVVEHGVERDRPWSKSITPSAFICSRIRSCFSLGMMAASRPRTISRVRLPSSRMRRVHRHDRRRAPARSAAPGRTGNCPRRAGTPRSNVLRICAAFRIGSAGNSTASSVLVFRPARRNSSSQVRLSASRPPMPVSVKPRPSGIGLKSSAVMMMRNEKPFAPSGRRVVIRPMAVSVRPPSTSAGRRPRTGPCPDRRTGSRRR